MIFFILLCLLLRFSTTFFILLIDFFKCKISFWFSLIIFLTEFLFQPDLATLISLNCPSVFSSTLLGF
jgi:hypothetical protein